MPITALAAALVAALPAPFPHATATPLCSSKAIPFPQTALAAVGDSLWVACRDRGTLLRLRATNGALVRTTRVAQFRPWALSGGFGALWAIDRDRPELWRLDPATGRRLRRIPLDGLPVYVWAGGGSVWVGFEDGRMVARVSPKTNRVTKVTAGDGASGFATDGRAVWIVAHRDNTLTRVDLTSGRARTFAQALSPPDTSAAERIAYAGGALWVTGRGLDLLRIDPASGTVQSTVEIGAAGIDVIAAGRSVVVAAATDEGARRGDPIVAAFRTVDSGTGSVTASTLATGRAYLSGVLVQRGMLWLGDTVTGRLVRQPVPRV